MKITQEHYNELKAKIATVNTKEMQASYKAVGLSDMRYRWDCYHASKCYSNDMYLYLNDSHIDTALKNIINELNMLV